MCPQSTDLARNSGFPPSPPSEATIPSHSPDKTGSKLERRMHRLLELLGPLPLSCPLFLEEGLSPTSLRQQKSGESVFPYLLITLKHIHNLAIFIPPFLIPMSHSPTHSCTHEQTPSESLCSGDLSLSLSTLKPSHVTPLLKVPLRVVVPLPPPPAAAPSCFFPPPTWSQFHAH